MVNEGFPMSDETIFVLDVKSCNNVENLLNFINAQIDKPVLHLLILLSGLSLVGQGMVIRCLLDRDILHNWVPSMWWFLNLGP